MNYTQNHIIKHTCAESNVWYSFNMNRSKNTGRITITVKTISNRKVKSKECH